MADYHTTAIILPPIPVTDVSPLEHLLLSHMIQVEPQGDNLFACIEQNYDSTPSVGIDELREAYKASLDYDSQLRPHVDGWINSLVDADDAADTEFDFSACLDDDAYLLILQDITRRSSGQRYYTVNGAYTCTRMRTDGFGGFAAFVTPSKIHWMSTNGWIESMFETLDIDA